MLGIGSFTVEDEKYPEHPSEKKQPMCSCRSVADCTYKLRSTLKGDEGNSLIPGRNVGPENARENSPRSHQQHTSSSTSK